MKKNLSKIMLLTLAVAVLLSIFCGCSCSSSSGGSYAGTWYNGCDLEDEPLILTKDGTFSHDGYGGDYTVEDGKIILNASLMSDVGEIDKVDGETVIVDDDGEIWFKGESAAKKYYEKKVNELIEYAKVNKNVVGAYTLGYYNMANKEKYYDANLRLKADGTYEYTSGLDTWQNGTWNFAWTGELPATEEEKEYFTIELHKTEGGGDSYTKYIENGIYTNDTDDLYCSGIVDGSRWFKD